MNKAIYIATSEENSGKSVVVLGLLRMLLGKAAKVGYFKPIINDMKEGEIDNHINTVISHFGLKVKPSEVFALTGSEFIDKFNEGKEDEIVDIIIEKFKQIEEKNDFMVVFRRKSVNILVIEVHYNFGLKMHICSICLS